MSFLDKTGLTYLWSKITDKLSNKLDKSDLLDLTHPVGSLYISSNSTDPSDLFGGTWEQIKDMMILAVRR